MMSQQHRLTFSKVFSHVLFASLEVLIELWVLNSDNFYMVVLFLFTFIEEIVLFTYFYCAVDYYSGVPPCENCKEIVPYLGQPQQKKLTFLFNDGSFLM